MVQHQSKHIKTSTRIKNDTNLSCSLTRTLNLNPVSPRKTLWMMCSCDEILLTDVHCQTGTVRGLSFGWKDDKTFHGLIWSAGFWVHRPVIQSQQWKKRKSAAAEEMLPRLTTDLHLYQLFILPWWKEFLFQTWLKCRCCGSVIHSILVFTKSATPSCSAVIPALYASPGIWLSHRLLINSRAYIQPSSNVFCVRYVVLGRETL